MIDIDSFKDYNDTYGHNAGDECIRAVAGTLQDTLKRPADIVARYGGEEFVVLLPDTGIEGAIGVAEDMRARVQQLAIPHAKSKAANTVTVSIGAASVVPSKNIPMAELIISADNALYDAKHDGRNRVKAYLKTDVNMDATQKAPAPQKDVPAIPQLRAGKEPAQTVLDCLAINVAVLDRDGGVISVNQPWRDYAIRQDESCLLSINAGTNYIEKCSTIEGHCTQYSMTASDGVSAVQTAVNCSESHACTHCPVFVQTCDGWQCLSESRWSLVDSRVCFSPSTVCLILPVPFRGPYGCQTRPSVSRRF
ncbi:Diguanylate cyclase, predicted domain protein [Candidatus Magnetobacterium bavaricum]|uniref:diguanylate cyclase n=1 Tax=Candidatus Magnetobacterium bavaricum TaxID=29290 RepID=A0A0F3GYL5_9BACT|nr:Diguanylate cyclase, predicted domain protein [Candidatus Magnetobacterium bavaricum]